MNSYFQVPCTPAATSKKESKKERRTRVAGEIQENVARIRVAVDAFKVSLRHDWPRVLLLISPFFPVLVSVLSADVPCLSGHSVPAQPLGHKARPG